MPNQLPSTNEHFMRRALELAQRASQIGEVPIGALIVLDDKIIGEGWNCPISTQDPTAHAEVIALRDAAKNIGNYRLINTTLYVTLEPCAMCVGAMLQARVGQVVFGASDPKAGAIVSVFNLLDSNALNHRITHTGGILADQCAQLLVEFFKAKR